MTDRSQRSSFRAAQPSDAESIARLHHLVRRVSMPYLPELHTLNEAIRYFGDVISRQTVLVAECSNSIVGYCAFRAGWLDHLYVRLSHQSRGIGSQLLARAMANNESLQLWVFQQNTGAIRFYERHGFTRIQTTDGSGNEEREPDALYKSMQ